MMHQIVITGATNQVDTLIADLANSINTSKSTVKHPAINSAFNCLGYRRIDLPIDEKTTLSFIHVSSSMYCNKLTYAPQIEHFLKSALCIIASDSAQTPTGKASEKAIMTIANKQCIPMIVNTSDTSIQTIVDNIKSKIEKSDATANFRSSVVSKEPISAPSAVTRMFTGVRNMLFSNRALAKPGTIEKPQRIISQEHSINCDENPESTYRK